MSKTFELVSTGNGSSLPEKPATVASATVIDPGTLVGLTSGIIVTAGAAHTKVAFCKDGSRDGETTVNISDGNDFILKGTLDANFAVTDKAVDCDITAAQLIDKGASATTVLTIDSSVNAGTVGATTDCRVTINKPL